MNKHKVMDAFAAVEELLGAELDGMERVALFSFLLQREWNGAIGAAEKLNLEPKKAEQTFTAARDAGVELAKLYDSVLKMDIGKAWGLEEPS